MPGQGSTSKKCVSCHAAINVACRSCRSCKAEQPHKLRLKKKMEKFDSKREGWVQTHKKNHTSCHIRDEASLLLEKLQALGVRAILLMSRPGRKPGTWVSERLSPRCHLTETSAACLKRMQGLFDVVIQGWTETEVAAATTGPAARPPAALTGTNATDSLESVVKETDPPHLSVCKEEVPPEQQERSPSLGQEEPEPLHIKEEPEELWTRKHLQGLEADVIKFTFTPVPAKSEHDEEKPQSSQLSQTQDPRPLQIKEEQEELFKDLEEADVITFTFNPVPVKSEHDGAKPQSSWFNQTQTEPLASTSTEQMKAEPDGEDCGVSEPAGHLDPAGDLAPTRDVQSPPDCSGTETDDDNDLKKSSEPHSGLKTLKAPFSPCCEVCGACFPKKSSLVRHVQVHSTDCGLCGKHLELTETLKLHLQSHRTCNFCSKTFASIVDVERHMRTHTGEKPFGCVECGKRFSQKQNLQTHMRTHTGEKPFSCSVCGKGFSQKESMLTHMRSHTMEKPFVCTVCGNRFSQGGALITHMRVHTGDKPFGCPVCSKSFSRKDILMTHMRSHSGEKPFDCTFCYKRFSEKGTLQKHMRIHTGEKPYGCIGCGKRFTQMPHLKNHKCRSDVSSSS